MGQPKLLLPWRDGLLIDHVLNAWTTSNVDEVVVVVRKDDEALTRACRSHRVHIVHPPEAPKDMKESLQCGLSEIDKMWSPKPNDSCFLAPADLPTLSHQLIDQLLCVDCDESVIVLPRFGEKPGHPVRLPWPITRELFELSADEGLDRIVARNRKCEVPFPAQAKTKDIDTPADYRDLLNAAEENSPRYPND